VTLAGVLMIKVEIAKIMKAGLGWAGLGWLGWAGLGPEKQYFVRRVAKVEIHKKICSGRGRRLFAHVLANIDIFDLLEAFKRLLLLILAWF